VFAVPGEITSGLSKGTNDLIRQGATPLLAVDDVFEALGFEARPPVAAVSSLSAEGVAVLTVLAEGPATLDELSRAAELGSPEVAVALTELELAGLVAGGDGLYRARGAGSERLAVEEPLVQGVGENNEAEGEDGEADGEAEADVE
jgi:DNA processing protein